MFPTLSESRIAQVEEYLSTITRIARPSLVRLMLDGSLNSIEPISGGEARNTAWQNVNRVGRAYIYTDESTRKRGKGADPARAQVDTLRFYRDRIAHAYHVVTGDTYPASHILFTAGDDPGTVLVWALR